MFDTISFNKVEIYVICFEHDIHILVFIGYSQLVHVHPG